MSKRKSLVDLMGEGGSFDETELQTTELQITELSEPVSDRDELLDAADESDAPKYLRFTRKEARLRDDQLEALTGLRRRLNKQRRGRGERITDNTLIRVAVDLLLAKREALRGASEEELLERLKGG